MAEARLILGACEDVLPTFADASVSAVVTDPPYGLQFMGKGWDHGVPGVPYWEATIRVLRPGGYLLAFGGTRTYHRLACAIEDAGFEMRDCLCWLYGSGFPKGPGCLKPAWEPILLARKPGPRVLPLGIDEGRVGFTRGVPGGRTSNVRTKYGNYTGGRNEDAAHDMGLGRYPANVAHDGSEEVLEAFAAFGERGDFMPAGAQSGKRRQGNTYGKHRESGFASHGDTGTAARFFYCAKASRRERGEGNTHPTVKPLALCEWLVKLVAREGETVLDPFAGSGTALLACERTGRKCIGIERDAAYHAIASQRLAAAREKAATLFTA